MLFLTLGWDSGQWGPHHSFGFRELADLKLWVTEWQGRAKHSFLKVSAMALCGSDTCAVGVPLVHGRQAGCSILEDFSEERGWQQHFSVCTHVPTGVAGLAGCD